jgi:Cu2+-exporting ATPase
MAPPAADPTAAPASPTVAPPPIAATGGCAHCGAPAVAATAVDGLAFCCTGCAVVYRAIRSAGLDAYYQLRDQALPARVTDRAYDELDDDAFRGLHVREQGRRRPRRALPRGSALHRVRLAGRVDAELRARRRRGPGRLGRGRVRRRVGPRRRGASCRTIARHLDSLGHPVHPYRGFDRDGASRRRTARDAPAIGVAGAALGNLMLLAIALYAGWFDRHGRGDEHRCSAGRRCWSPCRRSASPRCRSSAPRSARCAGVGLHLDLPLAIGIAVGLVWGSVNTIRGVGEIYFDSLAMLTFLLLVSRWIVSRSHRKAAAAAELLWR